MQMKPQGTMQRCRGWLWAALLGAGLCLLPAGAALAQRTEGDRAQAQGAYQAEVAVRNQTDGERDKAFARALAQVLGNVTGDDGAAQRPGVREELAKAEDYVEGYDYRQDEGVSATGAPSFQTMLVVRFRQQDVDDLVAMLGLPSWPQPRPKPVLWLAIDDGSGPRLVGLPQRNAARSLLDQAKSRGFALGKTISSPVGRMPTFGLQTASNERTPPASIAPIIAGSTMQNDGRIMSPAEISSPIWRTCCQGAAAAYSAIFPFCSTQSSIITTTSQPSDSGSPVSTRT